MDNLPAVIRNAVATQKIDLASVNLMMPSQTFGEIIGQFDKVSLEVVKVDPDPDKGDVFKVADGKFALSKIPLQKISSALSIQWVPEYTGIVESTPMKSRARATGVMRKPNGELVTVTDEKVIDLSVVEEEIRIKAEEDAQKGNPDGKVVEWGETRSGKKYPAKFEAWHSDEERNRWIEFKVRKDRLQKMKFKDELALTGAKDRVVRAFVATKSTYTAEELSKPFAFPRVTLDTGKMLADSSLRQAAIDMIAPNAASLFGPQKGAPQMAGAAPREGAAPGEPRDVTHSADEADDDVDFGDESGPASETAPNEGEAARNTLRDYLNSDVLNPRQKAVVSPLVESPTTPIETLLKYLDLCKQQEEARKKRGAA